MLIVIIIKNLNDCSNLLTYIVIINIILLSCFIRTKRQMQCICLFA
nr:MAG TPA_asm: hypothetical protein [Caudoviricetes sp.]